MSAAAIRGIMGQACRRAGLKRVGAHRLRHTLATEMLRGGASLPEIGQVLRHRSTLATSIYAKVDDNALRVLARPRPGSRRTVPVPSHCRQSSTLIPMQSLAGQSAVALRGTHMVASRS